MGMSRVQGLKVDIKISIPRSCRTYKSKSRNMASCHIKTKATCAQLGVLDCLESEK